MSLVPYSLARSFLFRLDPETAHDLTLKTLENLQGTPLQYLFGNDRIDDPLKLAGLTFPNRVGLAAGLDKNARCIDGFGAMGFGFIEVGTVTPKAQSGNPKPRMFRLPKAQALINRLGFNNDGLDAFIANVQHSEHYKRRLKKQHDSEDIKKKPPFMLGLNIGKNATTPIEQAPQDYLTCLDGVYPYADYVTVNISSPNTQNLRSLQSDEALDALLGALAHRRDILSQRHSRHVPVFVKIAPDLSPQQIEVIATTLKRYGTDEKGQPNHKWGVVATNTTLNREAVADLPHANETGGLSGTPVLAMSNQVIRQLRASLGHGFPIIGVGGIQSAQDALSKINAGADVVQIYTGLIYQGPKLITSVARLIKDKAEFSR